MTKADLHIHSNCSDGSDNIDILASNILNAGIDIFALTDHDGDLEFAYSANGSLKRNAARSYRGS